MDVFSLILFLWNNQVLATPQGMGEPSENPATIAKRMIHTFII